MGYFSNLWPILDIHDITARYLKVPKWDPNFGNYPYPTYFKGGLSCWGPFGTTRPGPRRGALASSWGSGPYRHLPGHCPCLEQHPVDI